MLPFWTEVNKITPGSVVFSGQLPEGAEQNSQSQSTMKVKG